eukprot:TRINITY_DN430_c0_g1_i6.p1 TRINITY_DN430_c0_g1~~TRINITY_DN430_c0_g1_i6.p1  ORF type:complete len:381 (+),score=134.68 TRINITY_DN430_c0_g1_i6:106-1248(+)
MGFTCIACRQMFDDAEKQRAHYHTDFHRFNLKRQATGLPPVTHDKYQEKLQVQVEKVERTRQTNYCSVCRKSFGSAKTLQQHLGSRKHFDRAQAEGVDPASGGESQEVPVAEEERTEEQIIEEKLQKAVELPLECCLFCNETARSVERNIEHMGSHHGFYIPFLRYLIDAEELLHYLGQKIGTGNSCIQCSRMYGSLDAARKHMTMTPHVRMAMEENLDEYGDFYDFSREFPDDGEEEEEATEEQEQEEEEATEGRGATSADGDVAAPSAAPAPSDAAKAIVLPHGFAIKTKEGNLIGHRELRVYYKQSYRHAHSSRTGDTIRSIMKQYRQMGALAPIGKNKPKQTKKHERDAHERNERFRLKTGVTANNQAHFRPQVIF